MIIFYRSIFVLNKEWVDSSSSGNNTPRNDVWPLVSSETYVVSSSSPVANSVSSAPRASHRVASSLPCLYTNATSLNSAKLHELELICALEGTKVVFVSETWFSQT